MKNRIRILTAMHGRQELVAAFFWQLEYLREVTSQALPVTIAVSSDEDFEFLTEPKNKFLTEDCNVVKTPNNPLTEKHNQALRAAMREKGWDLLMQLGSDDLVSKEYIDHITNLEVRSDCVYGVNDMYFYNLHSLNMRRFSYAKDILLGAGRVLPRPLLERCKGVKIKFRRPYYGFVANEEQYYVEGRCQTILERKAGERVPRAKKLHTLWSNKQDRGLDREAVRTLEAVGMVEQISLDDAFDEPQIIDCKTHESLTKWDRISGYNMPLKDIPEVINRIAPNISFE